MDLILLILLIVLVALAFGGLYLTKLLWILLIVVLILAIWHYAAGRRSRL